MPIGFRVGAAVTLSLLGLSALGALQDRSPGSFVTTSDGARIHVLEAGPDETGPGHPALLFIPGWTMPAWIWEKQIPVFAEDYRVVAMDPRSQGESSQETEGHYPAGRGRDIQAVIEQLDLAPVVLIGWSMGVIEVAAYVEEFGSGQLAALVLVDGDAGHGYDPDKTRRSLDWTAKFLKNCRLATQEFVHSMYWTPQTPKYLERVTAASLKTSTPVAVTLSVGSHTSDHRAALAELDRPVLIAAAVRDDEHPWYKELQQLVKGSRLATFEAGHALFVDEAERFNQVLNEFLGSLSEP